MFFSETKCHSITLLSAMGYLFFTLNLCHARLHTRGCVLLAWACAFEVVCLINLKPLSIITTTTDTTRAWATSHQQASTSAATKPCEHSIRVLPRLWCWCYRWRGSAASWTHDTVNLCSVFSGDDIKYWSPVLPSLIRQAATSSVQIQLFAEAAYKIRPSASDRSE